MDHAKPVFRIGQTNHYVQPGDYVWADLIVGRASAPGALPVVTRQPISGRVRPDGTVLLTNGKIVQLDQCRLVEKVIHLDEA